MGNKTRALGADVRILGAFETTYGALAATGAFKALSLKTWGLDSEKPLGRDPLIGQGRKMSDPFYEAVAVDGPIGIPLDVRGAGFFLKGLFGAPVSTAVKADGTISFSGQPANTATITLNGTVWTFVTGAPAGNQTQIQGSLAATLTQLATDLNASADAEVSKCTYTGGAAALTIQFDTAGTGGNSFTLAASANSNGTRSAATLLAGGYTHVFKSGAAELPSLCFELGHPQLSVAKYERYTGVKLGTLTFDLARAGPANAEIQAIAQGRLADAAASVDADPESFALQRFSRGRGAIKVDGVQLAAVTAGRFAFANNLEPVDEIRADSLIAGVDEGEPTLSGAITVRYGTDATLTDPVAAETPVALSFGFDTPERWALTFAAGRVFLPKPKKQVSGPAGIQAEYAFEAADKDADGTALTVTLLNDVAGY